MFGWKLVINQVKEGSFTSMRLLGAPLFATWPGSAQAKRQPMATLGMSVSVQAAQNSQMEATVDCSTFEGYL
jgi:hypothetical protein